MKPNPSFNIRGYRFELCRNGDGEAMVTWANQPQSPQGSRDEAPSLLLGELSGKLEKMGIRTSIFSCAFFANVMVKPHPDYSTEMVGRFIMKEGRKLEKKYANPNISIGGVPGKTYDSLEVYEDVGHALKKAGLPEEEFTALKAKLARALVSEAGGPMERQVASVLGGVSLPEEARRAVAREVMECYGAYLLSSPENYQTRG